MNDLRFAVCILFPGATSNNVVSAAIRHGVHILDRQLFDPGNAYQILGFSTNTQKVEILPLFLLPQDESILAEDEASLQKAIHKLGQLTA